MTGEEVLNIKLDGENDAGAETVRDYLKALLAALWNEGEGFSGKRPLGNSGWEHELLVPLEDFETTEQSADEMVWAAIQAL